MSNQEVIMSTKKVQSNAKLPEANEFGWVPTHNRFGFNSSDTDYLTDEFLALARKRNATVLDIGCSYGLQSLAALKKGARVVAVDIGSEELAVLREACPERYKEKLQIICGQFAAVDLQAQQFDAILARLSLHFSDGETLEKNIAKMFEHLKPGGKVFVMTTTDYAIRLQKMRQEYDRRKANGMKWPGYFHDMDRYRSNSEKDVLKGKVTVNSWTVDIAVSNPLSKMFVGPMHFIELATLVRAFESAGFSVEENEHFPEPKGKVDRRRPVNGREFGFLIASKPK
jgi:SAM-dependent methyltransferase